MVRFLVLLIISLLFAACREIPVDALYAVRLEEAPTDADWERALPRVVTVKGGRLHKINPIPDVDEDTVHVTTASCHHGSSLPDPVPVDMRAFYTDTDVYVRLSWPDLTRDDHFLEWEYDGAQWQSTGGLEDGFGIMWADPASYPSFTCSYACHLHDFGVSGSTFHASNRMKLSGEHAPLDLWVWKASRTARWGFADDRYLDREGMHGDLPGEIGRPNSRYFVNQPDSAPFTEGDAPVYDYDGVSVAGRFIPAGTKAPGYLIDRPKGGRSDVAARTRYRDGGWEVILHRKRVSSDRRDLSFVPGEGEALRFGLSIMDNTIDEHYASSTQERLILIPKGGMP